MANELLRTHRQIKEIEAQIDHEVQTDTLLTRLAAVTGKTTSLVLEAALGSPLDYPNPGSYLKAMGLNLKERSSGNHKGQLKITKRGPGIVRKIPMRARHLLGDLSGISLLRFSARRARGFWPVRVNLLALGRAAAEAHGTSRADTARSSR